MLFVLEFKQVVPFNQNLVWIDAIRRNKFLNYVYYIEG